ncbi:hypothetical protein AAZX31_08G169500 [Glycine max]
MLMDNYNVGEHLIWSHIRWTGGYQIRIIMCEQSFGEGYCYCCNRCQVYKEICRWGIYNLWYAGVQDLMPKYVFAVGDIHKAFHEFLKEG